VPREPLLPFGEIQIRRKTFVGQPWLWTDRCIFDKSAIARAAETVNRADRTRGMKILITGASGFIGTNAVAYFVSRGWDVLNIDIKKPLRADHERYWREGDVRERAELMAIFKAFKPDFVINMAAATGAHIPGLTEDFLAANTRGVENVIAAIASAGTVKRTIFVSSLLVCPNGYIPKSDDEYNPPNAYGASKAQGERIVRSAGVKSGDWVIVRPTSVWGPWFEHSYRAFFRLVSRGLYLHIEGNDKLIKPFTFVDNAIYMMEKLLLAAPGQVSGQTFYLVDYPEAPVSEWAESVRRATGSWRIRTAPYAVLNAAAKVGDVFAKAGWANAPLTSFRLENLMTGGRYPAAKTEAVVGKLPFSLDDGVRTTVAWMREIGEIKPA